MSAKKLAFVSALFALTLSACEPGAKITTQMGPRGTAMNQIVDVSNIKPAAYIPPPPYPLEPDTGGPRANVTYQNVQVLGDISTDEFNRLMLSMNDWIAPKAGCNYCHNPENMASDEIYTKVVARKMLQMTRNINTNWSSHVQKTGVTCYTCHRGNAVPEYKWSNQVAANMGTIRGNRHGQNAPSKQVGYASLPSNIYEPYLQGHQDVRVGSTDAYRIKASGAAIQTAEQTYGLMMRVSTALGVNCTYCHNTHNFGDWKTSTPQRVQAWYGIRMARNINNDYISSLKGVFPANRLGAAGDPYKVNCMTCHQGVNKPLGGYPMLKENPALAGVRKQSIAAAPPSAPELPKKVAMR